MPVAAAAKAAISDKQCFVEIQSLGSRLCGYCVNLWAAFVYDGKSCWHPGEDLWSIYKPVGKGTYFL